MASDEELGLALRDSCMDIVPDTSSEMWSTLPPELLEMIGSKLTEGAHLHNAAMVCKSWSASIATGLHSMELDMHSDPGMWRSKIEKLQSLIRHLRCVVIHVNAAISEEMLVQNVGLVQQLKDVEDLKLHLREGCDLPPAAAAAIGSMRHLTSLTIVGGGLKAEAAACLLAGLAAGGGGGGGGLRSLTLLPSVPYGLGDAEMAALAACSSLEVLEFRAYRLTSAGLAALSLGLPRLTRLAITSLDSDSGYELACLERCAALADLQLAMEAAPLGAAGRAALLGCAARPGRSLSLAFRWTDKAQGLLTEYGNRLANLTQLDVGACRVGSETLFEAVAQLTGLRELRMAVYSNSDTSIPCHLSRLSALAALQRFHLEKRKAYFPEARRFGESSIAVPVTAEGLRSLAGRWSRLRSLRLALSRKDYSPEALAVLSSFTGLRELGIVVERYNQQQQQQQNNTQQQQTQSAATAAAAGAGGSGTGHWGQASGDGGVGVGVGVSGISGRLSRRAVEPPPLLDLACLPAGLQSLELNNLLLDMSEATAAAAVVGAVVGAVHAAVAPEAPQLAATALGFGAPGLTPSLGLGLGSPNVQPAAFFSAAATPPLPSLPPPPPPPPLPLSQLTSLDVEACVVRPPLLAAVARRCGGSLRSLRLVGVVGLSDGALAECLPALKALRSLTLSAPGNRAVSQASLFALSAAPSSSPPPAYPAYPPASGGGGGDLTTPPPPPTTTPTMSSSSSSSRSPRAVLLRQLSWESDDLTALGPQLGALAPLSGLRHLYLSCTDKTAELALGGSLRVLRDALPYCHVDMVWTAARPGDAP